MLNYTKKDGTFVLFLLVDENGHIKNKLRIHVEICFINDLNNC